MSRRRRDYTEGKLRGDLIAELESIEGWVWNAYESKWNTHIADLRTLITENGHAKVPKHHPLAVWMVACRTDYAAGKLTAERIAELETIDGWVWNALNAKWSVGITHVRAYAAAFGHANSPQKYISPDGYRTGLWISKCRRSYAAGKLTPERIAELESIPGWVWRTRSPAHSRFGRASLPEIS